MLTIRILILLFFISFSTHAQRVYWASNVLDYSSELSQNEYSAKQVLGKPNAMPQGGDNPSAWMPAKPNKLDYISVTFDKTIRIQQIVIAESYNPSSLYEIYLYDKNGNEFLVHTFRPRPIDLNSRLLRINIEKTKYKVKQLKIVLDGRKVPGYTGIDAIGVSGSNKPVVITIDQPQNLIEDILIERLSENINSSYEETRPLISPDGKTLYFSRAYHPENTGGERDENDIWYAEFNDDTGEWSKSKNLGTPLNNKGPNYISSITPDGNAMLVLLGNQYIKRNKMNPGVSISTKSSEGWSKPETLEIINAGIETTDGNYFLSSNRKVMIMAIDRFDAFGGKDLYISFLQGNNRWTEPLNLGNDINTANMESSPFLAADNETLYFSSKGFSGYGKSDIYISRRLDDTWTNWTEPENLGSTINSVGDDVFFNIPPSGKSAYYSKSKEDGYGEIYKIAMPIFYQPSPVVRITGKVLDAASTEPVMAKVFYNLLPENTDIGFTISDSLTGEYEILLPVGSAYNYTVDAFGYKNKSNQIDLLNDIDFKEIKLDILLEKGEDGLSKVKIANATDYSSLEDFISGRKDKLILECSIIYNFASDFINENTYPILDKIIIFLHENPSIELVFSGHSDNVGTEQFNVSLSERRAQSILDYFIKNEIAPSRLEILAQGFKQPIASNESEEGRTINRRVEISIKK